MERVAWEGKAIAAEWLGGAREGPETEGIKPPKATTCEDRIRPLFNMIQRDCAGKIINVAQILEAMGYPINPANSRAAA